MDKAQRDLDAAQERYRKQYDRGYLLSQKGEDERAQSILDRANDEWDAAKSAFAQARRERPVPNRPMTAGEEYDRTI
jgi:hypothetical protein